MTFSPKFLKKVDNVLDLNLGHRKKSQHKLGIIILDLKIHVSPNSQYD